MDFSIAESEEALARFRREAQAAADLRSTHVVHILDYGLDDGRPFIAMELLDGECLAQRLERTKRLAPVEVADVLSQVGRALTWAHQHDIVHGALKPGNIYLVTDGDEEIAKVLDVGISKQFVSCTASNRVMAQTGVLLGVPHDNYMSPEQAMGQSTIDHRTDIWSLGMVAYECLTGVRPFDADTATSLLSSICTRNLPVPSSVAEVPAGFDGWFARATERNPDQRFQSVSDATAELRRVLWEDVRTKQRAVISKALPGDGATAKAFSQKTFGSSARKFGSLPRRSSRVALIIAAGVVALIGLGVGAARLLRCAQTSHNTSTTTRTNPADTQSEVSARKRP
jgi:serine/threonine-protein kinase